MAKIKKNEYIRLFQLLPIIIFTGLVIMLMGFNLYKDLQNVYYWLNVGSNTAEIYNFAKFSGVIVASILAAINIIYSIWTANFKIKKLPQYYIPMAIFTAFLILSFIFSEHKEIALWGWRDLYEGTITWLCYIFMLFYTINYINSEKDIKLVVFWVLGFVALINILGLFQMLGINFLYTDIIKNLLVPANLQNRFSLINSMNSNCASQTLYNINYVSFYLSMVISFIAIMFISAKKIFTKVILGFFFCLLIINLFGSSSSGGLIGLTLAVLVAIALLNKKLITWWKSIAILILISGFAAFLCFPFILSEIDSLKDLALDYDIKNNAIENKENKNVYSLPNQRIKIDYIETLSDGFDISFYGNVLSVKYDATAKPVCYDSSNNEISLNAVVTDADKKEVTYYLLDDRFAPYVTLKTFSHNNLIILNTPDCDWKFKKTDRFYYENIYGKSVTLTKIPAFGFSNSEKFGTFRGYIWSRTLPLLKDVIFIGHGANTFAIFFPQNDYVGKYNIGLGFNTIYDKPHNLYLGITMNSGIISLAAFLIIFGIYIFDSIKIYKNLVNKDRFLMFVGAGLFLGICAFLGSAMVNDSNLSVMPMFIGFLGIGIVCNHLLYNIVEKK